MTAKTGKRCHHCGREVEETRHTRTSYTVGYYALYGGCVEEATLTRPLEDGGSLTILRLVEPTEWYTCADCYRLPEVLDEREGLFRPEILEREPPES
jgi:hypothetical protein